MKVKERRNRECLTSMPLGKPLSLICLQYMYKWWCPRFQELDLSAQALMGVESSNSREEMWTNAVEATLRKMGKYHKVKRNMANSLPATILSSW